MHEFPIDCANQYMILRVKKGLNISLSFKFNPRSSNYYKLIKLNFVLQNQKLIKWCNISLTPQDLHTRSWKKKNLEINHKSNQLWRIKLENKKIKGWNYTKFQRLQKKKQQHCPFTMYSESMRAIRGGFLSY